MIPNPRACNLPHPINKLDSGGKTININKFKVQNEKQKTKKPPLPERRGEERRVALTYIGGRGTVSLSWPLFLLTESE